MSTEENSALLTLQEVVERGEGLTLLARSMPGVWLFTKSMEGFERGDIVSDRQELPTFWEPVRDPALPDVPVNDDDPTDDPGVPEEPESASDGRTEPVGWSYDTTYTLEEYEDTIYRQVRVMRYASVSSLTHLEDNDFRAVMRFLFTQDELTEESVA